MLTELSATQHDALTELVNISFGRAAAALSDLTGERVLLSVPEVRICPLASLHAVLACLITGEVTSVHQIFTGPVAGDAMLLFDYPGALALAELLSEDRVPVSRLDASDREVITEVGNIILNACLGTLGNLLKAQISFSVPRIHIDSLEGLLTTLLIDHQELRYALVITADFKLKASNVEGVLVIVLGVASLESLLEAITRLG